MKDIIRKILKENRKQRFFDFIVIDMLKDTEIEGDLERGFTLDLPFDNIGFTFPPGLSVESLSNDISWEAWSKTYAIGGQASEYLEQKYAFDRSDHYIVMNPYWAEIKNIARSSGI